ncbi:lytic polysaccharide monooxygenase [Nonomuraea soli]|uniref:Chitin-binding protein n=1 Tax=Nonomuraea soli TaxID=1032476 RepID=A0A7W0CKI1_9ACTN|nr:lytic polysaccharide monooxygenase [Nonomuraea soli]MBA2892637.1 chitin-binding protein [Nonomuraea soli]
MRRALTLLFAVLMGIATSIVVTSSPAQAHGWITNPSSRQDHCAAGRVANCGPIIWEPQSVEGPKGQRNCHAGDSRWAPLNDDSKPWPVTNVGTTATLTWKITARHSTSTWEYYIGGTRVAVFNDGGRQPPASFSHTVNFSGFSGRQKVLAIWNVADTPMAFYACLDLNIGGGPQPSPSPTPTATQSPTPTPTPTPTSSPGGTWKAGTAYSAGTTVTYGGLTYRCRQSHTAIAGWEPPNVPALWERV